MLIAAQKEAAKLHPNMMCAAVSSAPLQISQAASCSTSGSCSTIADLTSSVMQHVPPFQVFPALNSVPDEEPGEELHSWGSPVVPNEGSEWACGVPRGVQQPIKRRGVQLAVRVGERARPPVWYLRRTPPSHDRGNLSQLSSCATAVNRVVSTGHRPDR